jgi:hypothetical protein
MDETTQEESNDQCTDCPDPVNRRDFLRNKGKVGIGGAIALYLGLKMKDEASAHSNCSFVSQETRYSPDCPTHQSCWFWVRCSDGHYFAYRVHCGYCTGNP